MDNKINFQQLVEQYAQASGMSKNGSEQFVKSFFDTVSDGVLEEGLVKIKGLGTFKLVEIEDRESVNVNTGERIIIEGRRKINFIPEAGLKDYINKPFSAFDTIRLNDNQLNELARMEHESKSGDSESENVPAESPAVDTAKEKSDDKPKREKVKDDEIARKVAAVKAMAKEKETAVQETTDVVLVGPMLPSVGPNDREIHRLPIFVTVILKILAWVLSIIVALWVIVYAVWPAVAVAIFRDMEEERKYNHASAVQQRLEYEQLMSLYDDSVHTVTCTTESAMNDSTSIDTVSENVSQAVVESVSETESASKTETAVQQPVVRQPKAVMKASATGKPAVEKTVAESVANGSLVLLDSDEKRELSEYTEADTVNYRIAGLLAEHVVQPGETLSRLALKYYGTKKLWPYIAKFNKADMNRINTNDVIRIPVLVNK